MSSEYAESGYRPKMRKAALAGGPVRKEVISKEDNTEIAIRLQQQRLRSRFGFAVETAAAISALAFGVMR